MNMNMNRRETLKLKLKRKRPLPPPSSSIASTSTSTSASTSIHPNNNNGGKNNINIKIKGVPVAFTPVLIQTMKQLSKHLKQNPISDYFHKHTNQKDDVHVLDEIMMKSKSKSSKLTSKSAIQIQTILQSFIKSLQSHSIKTHVHVSLFYFCMATITHCNSNNNSNNNNHNPYINQSISISITNQRAALHLCHVFLSCSKACREAFATCTYPYQYSNPHNNGKDNNNGRDGNEVLVKIWLDALLGMSSSIATNTN